MCDSTPAPACRACDVTTKCSRAATPAAAAATAMMRAAKLVTAPTRNERDQRAQGKVASETVARTAPLPFDAAGARGAKLTC